MDPIFKAFLLSWDLRIEVCLVLGLFGVIQFIGWWRLRQRSRKRFANVKRLLSYASGLIVLGIALMSPIDVLGGQLFYMHMIQHLLVVMVAPPLLLLANPFPIFLWSLPRGARRSVAGWFRHDSQLRHLLQQMTRPGLTWMVFVAVFLGWHDPHAYNLALRNGFVHDLEHITFFATALLFWWHVIAAGPRIHGQFPVAARIAYVVSAIVPNMLVGVALAFASAPIYTYYTTIPRLWGVDVMYDQMMGGIIMWIPGSMMYIIAALILLARLFSAEEDKPLLQVSDWSTEDALIAPGLEKRRHQAKLHKLTSG